jgi:Ni,Fe-hydrogenase III large subunit/Ni,Fe-hydrogenase III component G
MSSESTALASPVRQSKLVAPDELETEAAALFAAGFRLALVAGHDDAPRLRAVYVFTAGAPDRRVELQVRLDSTRPVVPSLARLSFSASRFEREMHDLFGICPIGHPFLRPLVLHQHWPPGWHPMCHDAGEAPPMRSDAEPFPFVAVEGPGVYEIPVGPVHAGLIEPGHFRFSVVGETILKMKARLWFVHRGIEKLFEGREMTDGVVLAERISGDTAVGHNLAYCLAVEDACRVERSEEAGRLRALLLELERIYNHVADVGALCNDVGYGIANARALTLREKLLRLNFEITGHRLLRGAIRPGATSLLRLPTEVELDEVAAAFEDLVDVASANTVVMDRFKGTAVLSESDARAIGTLGVVARASGLALDARTAHPFCEMGTDLLVVIEDAGDVMARFSVRTREVRASLGVVATLAGDARRLEVVVPSLPRRGGSGLGIVEGWRGTIVHRVETDASGRLTRCKVVDPSFLNWPALSVALADTIVPDFPLANKSFNLSYAGNDL